MKKLSLEMLRLTSDEVLEKSQMKKITGGYGSVWYCYCTHSSGNYGHYAALYPSGEAALWDMANRCQGNGACHLQ